MPKISIEISTGFKKISSKLKNSWQTNCNLEIKLREIKLKRSHESNLDQPAEKRRRLTNEEYKRVLIKKKKEAKKRERNETLLNLCCLCLNVLFIIHKNKCLCDISTSKDFSKKTSQKSTILSDKPYIVKKVKLENAAEKVAF